MKNIPLTKHCDRMKALQENTTVEYSMAKAATYLNENYIILCGRFGRNKLIQFYREIGVFLPKSRIPFERYEGRNIFIVKRTVSSNGFQNSTAYLTGNGLSQTIEKLLKMGIIDIEEGDVNEAS